MSMAPVRLCVATTTDKAVLVSYKEAIMSQVPNTMQLQVMNCNSKSIPKPLSDAIIEVKSELQVK